MTDWIWERGNCYNQYGCTPNRHSCLVPCLNMIVPPPPFPPPGLWSHYGHHHHCLTRTHSKPKSNLIMPEPTSLSGPGLLGMLTSSWTRFEAIRLVKLDFGGQTYSLGHGTDCLLWVRPYKPRVITSNCLHVTLIYIRCLCKPWVPKGKVHSWPMAKGVEHVEKYVDNCVLKVKVTHTSCKRSYQCVHTV